ncbi:MAG: DUF1028 domain-containing protein [Candidatus Marinimicrobia bacterium]|nr:DUF1028 domain-containing protein [Candidatus Neomarinimicrobiota bacterium]
MSKILSYTICFYFSLVGQVLSQDTFSIIAVDTITGKVGSAGASCIQGSIIISDIHPGLGGIHTQAYWNAINQDSASSLMDQGYSPEEIIDWLISNDAQNDPSIRQYGIEIWRMVAGVRLILEGIVRILKVIRLARIMQFKGIYYLVNPFLTRWKRPF